MYEFAQELFDYLSICRGTQENDYINHFWQVFITLDSGDEMAWRPTLPPKNPSVQKFWGQSPSRRAKRILNIDENVVDDVPF